MNNILLGAISGFAATAVMTGAMELMFRRLPRSEQYPLPPREITMRIAQQSGIERSLDEQQRVAATLAAHFAFGAGAGALYPAFAEKLKVPPAVTGIAYGVAVWIVSYLGWIPALKILKPATAHPFRRNALMIAAHVVWGVATGLMSDRLKTGRM